MCVQHNVGLKKNCGYFFCDEKLIIVNGALIYQVKSFLNILLSTTLESGEIFYTSPVVESNFIDIFFLFQPNCV